MSSKVFEDAKWITPEEKAEPGLEVKKLTCGKYDF